MLRAQLTRFLWLQVSCIEALMQGKPAVQGAQLLHRLLTCLLSSSSEAALAHFANTYLHFEDVR